MKIIRGLFVDLIGLTGMASLCYGIWQIHQPSSFIVGGFLCLAYAVLANRSPKRVEK